MKLRIFYLSLVLIGHLSSCNDDEAEVKATIIGEWQGDVADLNIEPDGFPIGIPYSIDDFHTMIDFKSDGTLVLTDENTTSAGSYVLEGEKLTINSDLTIEDINMSGTYDVKTLDKSTLEIEIEKDATVKNPNDGSDVSGRVRATLRFNRR
jgi:hypothetical protein